MQTTPFSSDPTEQRGWDSDETCYGQSYFIALYR